MFLCKECHGEQGPCGCNQDFKLHLKSSGPCERCGKVVDTADCHNYDFRKFRSPQEEGKEFTERLHQVGIEAQEDGHVFEFVFPDGVIFEAYKSTGYICIQKRPKEEIHANS